MTIPSSLIHRVTPPAVIAVPNGIDWRMTHQFLADPDPRKWGQVRRGLLTVPPGLTLPPGIARGIHGLGQTPSLDSGDIAKIAAQGAATTGAIVALLPGFALAGPVGAAVAGLVAVGVAISGIFSGCGQTCVLASNIANQVEPYLLQNLQHYLSTPVRYASMQAAALNNFDMAWNALLHACSDPTLGNAGQHCISDRQEGSCYFNATSKGGWAQAADGSWNYTGYGPGQAGTGICWNWFIGYRDPIANDPAVLPDPVTASDVPAGVIGAGSTGGVVSSGMPYNPAPLFVAVGALIVGFWIMYW